MRRTFVQKVAPNIPDTFPLQLGATLQTTSSRYRSHIGIHIKHILRKPSSKIPSAFWNPKMSIGQVPDSILNVSSLIGEGSRSVGEGPKVHRARFKVHRARFRFHRGDSKFHREGFKFHRGGSKLRREGFKVPPWHNTFHSLGIIFSTPLA